MMHGMVRPCGQHKHSICMCLNFAINSAEMAGWVPLPYAVHLPWKFENSREGIKSMKCGKYDSMTGRLEFSFKRHFCIPGGF